MAAATNMERGMMVGQLPQAKRVKQLRRLAYPWQNKWQRKLLQTIRKRNMELWIMKVSKQEFSCNSIRSATLSFGATLTKNGKGKRRKGRQGT
jgi:hypothetical protein